MMMKINLATLLLLCSCNEYSFAYYGNSYPTSHPTKIPVTCKSSDECGPDMNCIITVEVDQPTNIGVCSRKYSTCYIGNEWCSK